ncbi:MAG: alpha/beta hydrolase [Chloroflexi bacterium]|nr:alpha/beta hydrolase [Chloroflexota bacterium]MBV9545732.1 alpha/beta hydrolase [Chloroflexota bacterium]
MTLHERTIALPRHGTQVVFTAGEGAPLVWLHGINGPQADAPVIDGLTAKHSVYAPLAPGFNNLEELLDLRDVHDLAIHYDDVLDALELDRVILAGHSFGAMIAAEYAAHYPKRVEKLILISPVGLWNDAYPVADLWGVPSPELPKLLYADGSEATQTQSTDVESIVRLVSGMASVARFLWPIPDRGLSRRLYRISAPALLVHGQKDAFVPVQYADDFLNALPNATKVVVQGAGHMLPIEQPEAVLTPVQQFLGREEAVAG